MFVYATKSQRATWQSRRLRLSGAIVAHSCHKIARQNRRCDIDLNVVEEACCDEDTPSSRYEAGFAACVAEVGRYLTSSVDVLPQLSATVLPHLVDHLAGCLRRRRLGTPTWHVSSCSGVATLQTAIHLLLTYLLTYLPTSALETTLARRQCDSQQLVGGQQSSNDFNCSFYRQVGALASV